MYIAYHMPKLYIIHDYKYIISYSLCMNYIFFIHYYIFADQERKFAFKIFPS